MAWRQGVDVTITRREADRRGTVRTITVAELHNCAFGVPSSKDPVDRAVVPVTGVVLRGQQDAPVGVQPSDVVEVHAGFYAGKWRPVGEVGDVVSPYSGRHFGWRLQLTRGDTA